MLCILGFDSLGVMVEVLKSTQVQFKALMSDIRNVGLEVYKENNKLRDKVKEQGKVIAELKKLLKKDFSLGGKEYKSLFKENCKLKLTIKQLQMKNLK